MEALLSNWGILANYHLSPITDGLINKSFKVVSDGSPLPHQNRDIFDSAQKGNAFILQRINQEVFKRPEDLMTNHGILSDHLSKKKYTLKWPIWFEAEGGKSIVFFENEYWRLGAFFEETQNYASAQTPEMAYKSGHAFGQFDLCLFNLSPDSLLDTIHDFHNLGRYLKKIEHTIQAAPGSKIRKTKDLLSSLDDYLFLTKLSFTKNRVIHNDAKISNLLFKESEVYAVIDWDTTMAGHISWEYGDLFRSTGVTVAEDHPFISDIELNYEMIEGLSAGYKSMLFDHLSPDEQSSLYYGSMYIIFEQAIRFLEDFLAGDIYYRCSIDDHNLIRARNQFYLLSLMNKNKKNINACIQRS